VEFHPEKYCSKNSKKKVFLEKHKTCQIRKLSTKGTLLKLAKFGQKFQFLGIVMVFTTYDTDICDIIQNYTNQLIAEFHPENERSKNSKKKVFLEKHKTCLIRKLSTKDQLLKLAKFGQKFQK
jgi:hypothetical protein